MVQLCTGYQVPVTARDGAAARRDDDAKIDREGACVGATCMDVDPTDLTSTSSPAPFSALRPGGLLVLTLKCITGPGKEKIMVKQATDILRGKRDWCT